MEDSKEDCDPKMLTKQEVELKSKSSHRWMDIPDVVFEAILEQRKIYEKNRRRRINDKNNPFRDLDYVCCSTYGKPRSKGFVDKYYNEIKEKNNLPDLNWHKMRTSFSTILTKNNFSLKAISILLGHSNEIITFQNYTDKDEIIYDCVEDIEPFIDDVIPKDDETILNEDDILIDVKLDTIMQEEIESLIA